MLLLTILEQSLVFFPFALGVYLSYIILNTADLTVDGSFVLGAGIFSKLLCSGFSPLSAICIATIAGGICGIGVSLIQYKNRVSPLIAGILALFILQSVNLIVMGKPSIHLLGQQTLFKQFTRKRILLFLYR